MDEFRKLEGTNWEFDSKGFAKYGGKVKQVLSGKIFFKGTMHNIVDIIDNLFKETTKDVTKKELTVSTTYKHALKGTVKSDKTKELMSKAKYKPTHINGNSYASIKEAAKELNINRSTIYRINKKPLIT